MLRNWNDAHEVPAHKDKRKCFYSVSQLIIFLNELN